MYTVERSALVMHSVEDMYSIVNDIDSYSNFLPWCGGSKVLEQTDREMVAQIRIAFRGIKKTFTTRNQLVPFEKTIMMLMDGPFSELSGTWEFKALQPGACKVSLNLQFDFSNVLVGKVVGPIFKFIADSMVESFVRRADEIYND